MPSIFIAERLLTGGSSATMALPDWQSGENAKNHTEFLLPPSKGSHPTNSSMGILVLSEIGFFITNNLSHLAHHCTRTSHTLRMLIAQILTYRTPTRCNAPSQWGTDFCGLKSPSQADSHGFLSTEADRSRQKHKKHIRNVRCILCVSHIQ